MIFLKDISFELSKKQTRKFSRIFLLKKALKINKFYENFEFVFKRIVFSKNPFVFMDFLEYFYGLYYIISIFVLVFFII